MRSIMGEIISHKRGAQGRAFIIEGERGEVGKQQRQRSLHLPASPPSSSSFPQSTLPQWDRPWNCWAALSWAQLRMPQIYLFWLPGILLLKDVKRLISVRIYEQRILNMQTGFFLNCFLSFFFFVTQRYGSLGRGNRMDIL